MTIFKQLAAAATLVEMAIDRHGEHSDEASAARSELADLLPAVVALLPYRDPLPNVLVEMLRRIHSPRTYDGEGYGWTVCVEDRQHWPCVTERAIQEALS